MKPPLQTKMPAVAVASDQIDEDDDYYYVPESAFGMLPEALREHYEQAGREGRAMLETVERELTQAHRLSRSMAHFGTLRHVQEKLAAYRFKLDMAAIYELDMLTTAFVVVYARLQQGGGGIGFDPKSLPHHLKGKHQEIINLRNKRFAHDEEQLGFISNETEIQSIDGEFQLHSSLSIRFQIGGDPMWKELVDAIEVILADRSDKLIRRLSRKTGKAWSLASKPE